MKTSLPSLAFRDAGSAALIATGIWLTQFAILMGFALTGDYPHPVEAAVRRLAMAAMGVLLFWAVDRLFSLAADLSAPRRVILILLMIAAASLCWSISAFAIAHVDIGRDTHVARSVGVGREIALNSVASAGLFAAWVAVLVALSYRRMLAEAKLGSPFDRRGGGAPASPDGLQQAAPAERYLWVPTVRGQTLLSLDEVEYLEADHDYVRVHSCRGRYMLHSTLQVLHNDLTSRGFMRVHRTFVVNIQQVIGFDRRGTGLWELTLASGARIPVGRTYSDAVRAWTRSRDM